MSRFAQLLCLTVALTAGSLAGPVWATPYSDAVLADNPVAYYQFEDASSANLATAANSGTTGSAIDGTYHGGGMSLVANSYHANLGNAVNVTSNSYVDAPDHNSLDLTTGATLEAWVNFTATNTWARILDKTRGSAYMLAMQNTNGWAFAEAGSDQVASSTVLRNTGWRHVVATYDTTLGSDQWKIYIDGNLDGVHTTSNDIGTNTSLLTLFKDTPGADYYTGLADEIAIYNYALSEARIDAHYAAASAVPEPSTFALAGLGLLGLIGYGVRRRQR